MDQHIPDLVSEWGIAPKYMAIVQTEQRQISAHFQRKKGNLPIRQLWYNSLTGVSTWLAWAISWGHCFCKWSNSKPSSNLLFIYGWYASHQYIYMVYDCFTAHISHISWIILTKSAAWCLAPLRGWHRASDEVGGGSANIGTCLKQLRWKLWFPPTHETLWN